ncbi:MAG: exosome complex RNA-binding protein Csl4 [Candidatus Lokiarchaeota archaeon]|nr:exosome complex RNA-binding protein Csl4 [Candidatus Lokiarchaeota archaeon]
MKKILKNNDIVLTGEYLGVVEEYLPDKNSTFIKDGAIYATKTGLINLDMDKRKIEINTHQDEDRKTIKLGDIVIGSILFIRKYSVGLNFYTINKKVHFNSYFFGNVHVSQISNKYIEQISDAFRVTDIIRAKVVEEKENEFDLSTSGKDLGVIHADCTVCGTKFDKIAFGKLECSTCGNMENRKLAYDYGEINEHLRY